MFDIDIFGRYARDYREEKPEIIQKEYERRVSSGEGTPLSDFRVADSRIHPWILIKNSKLSRCTIYSYLMINALERESRRNCEDRIATLRF